MTDELIFTRIFHAPRRLVFACMTSAEHLTHFWGPAGVSAPPSGISVDCRPGGRFEVLMQSDDHSGSYLMRVVYDEVSAPELLVWTDVDTGMRTTSTFVDLGDGRTEVRIHQAHLPAFARSEDAQAGFRTSLDKLDRYLASLSAVGLR